MLSIENTEIVGWEQAIRGMRNPMNSWKKSDSEQKFESAHDLTGRYYEVGPNDLSLMTKLRNAGTDHRKFMRMLVVYLDVIAPLYWWKEMDTYKVGTVTNSCSTMHKIQEKEFAIDDFSHEHMDVLTLDVMTQHIIPTLNIYRKLFCGIESGTRKDQKSDWWQMIQLLPSSYNQRRTVMLNYEVLANIHKSRRNHKLDEWISFCGWIETLPHFKEIMSADKN